MKKKKWEFGQINDSTEEQVSRANKLAGEYGDGRVKEELMPLVFALGYACTPSMALQLFIADQDHGEDGVRLCIESGLGAATALGMTVLYGALVQTGNEESADQAIDYLLKGNPALERFG